METYMDVGWDNRYRIAPNNAFGRIGATLYQKSDEGMGMAMVGVFGSVIFGMMPLFSFMEGDIALGFILLIPLLLVLFGPLCTLYARLFCRSHQSAREMSEVRETYRAMSRSDRAIVRPLVNNMEQCRGYGYSYDFTKRKDAFDEFVNLTQTKHRAIKDDSDIESLNTFLDGMKQLRREAEKRGLTS